MKAIITLTVLISVAILDYYYKSDVKKESVVEDEIENSMSSIKK